MSWLACISIHARARRELGGAAGQLAQGHQFGQRRQAAGLPWLAPRAANFIGYFRLDEEGQTLVAAAVVGMRATEFITGPTQQHRARHQFESLAAALAAEAARLHVRHRPIRVLLGIRSSRRSGGAGVDRHRYGAADKRHDRQHGGSLRFVCT
jgi:hypothetical protein